MGEDKTMQEYFLKCWSRWHYLACHVSAGSSHGAFGSGIELFKHSDIYILRIWRPN